MRLFVAVLPPREQTAALGDAVAELRRLPDADRLRWTEPAGWHFTLAFLGEVEVDEPVEGRAPAGRAPADGPDLAGEPVPPESAVLPEPLPELLPELLLELHTRLRRAAHRHAPFRLRLAGGGRFGERALWVGAEGDREPLRRLAQSVRAGARRAGAPSDESRRFVPHLTIARNRGGAELRPFAQALAGFTGRDWQIVDIALVRSHPPTAGVPGAQPRYETLARWPLGGRPAGAG
ncbi:2'-5' RNA ligase family protein [Streptomyces sp. H27-D2]|uniref:2'-5' RNA ligase family protein n=1 Tax=Streptomyces sp. H27-D2 TaxID=3046304 RepID=UPI002DC0383D|nr:2'-5' RNA ligase family protein [Streptomyces sp. H27-D2]MEC4016836.1 2'-5' RNA ligase family protein [Streptomyces sp. H27-D2]